MITQQIVQLRQIGGVVLERLLVHVEELDASDDGSLLDIRIRVGHSDIDGLLDVFGHTIEFE